MTTTTTSDVAHASSRLPLIGRWMRFWFAPMPAFNFALFRTGLGLLTVLWFLTLIRDFQTFFGEGSLAVERTGATGTFNVFLLVDSDIFLWAGLAVGILSGGLLIVGRLTRIGGPVLAILVASMMAENRMLWNAGDDLLQTFCLLFGLFCLLTPSSDLDTPLRSSVGDTSTLATGRFWFFQLVRIQITVVYLVAFLAKIPGSMWRDGTATMVVLRVETLERFPTPPWLETNYLVGNVTTWSTLALEGMLPFLLWHRPTRPYAIAAAVAFHLMIDWSLAIGLFSWIMILGLTSFLSPGFGLRLRSVGRKLARTWPGPPSDS